MNRVTYISAIISARHGRASSLEWSLISVKNGKISNMQPKHILRSDFHLTKRCLKAKEMDGSVEEVVAVDPRNTCKTRYDLIPL